MFLELNTQAFNIYLLFFGFWLVLTGYLILRSTFMPGVLGALVVFAGSCWLILLYPPLASSLYPLYLLPSSVGETALLLWLLAKGADAQRWKEQASAAGIASAAR